MPVSQTNKIDLAHMERAVYYAERSNIKTFSTGAIVVDVRGRHVASGWSHYSQLVLANYRSIHAELHAILRTPHKPLLWGSTIYVATIRNKSRKRSLGIGKPCKHCMALLYETKVKRIVYTDGQGDIESLWLW